MKSVKRIFAIICTLATFQLSAADGVARATFTSAIDNREPVDEITNLADDANKIYYFTEISGLKGQTITHRWEQNGEVQANVTFDVGGNRWRIWSSKNLQPELTGEWQVMVVDEANNVLSQNSFNYGEATTQAPAEAATTTATTATTEATTATETQATEAISEEELSKIAPAAGGNTDAAKQEAAPETAQ